MKTPLPLTRDLVLIGGGHTHALVMRKWAMNPLPGARLTLIDPSPTAAYSGMLPGFVAGHYQREDLGIDLVRLGRMAGARVILGSVTGMDRTLREIHVPGRPPIAYDIAAIDIGITSAMPQLSGFSEHAIPAKPLTPFAKRWNSYRASDTPKHIAVIGGGVAGAELAMAMAHALRQARAEFTLHLIDQSMALQEATVPGRDKLHDAMEALGITVLENANVVSISADNVTLRSGETIPSTFTVGAAGARPHEWQSDIGLEVQDGFLSVGPTLQTSDPAIFATGDCAYLSHDPRPKAGVFAVRQAPVLFDNLRATLSDRPLRTYAPQRDYLKLISLGDQSALAEKWGRAISGPALWRWKDRIDQKFMRQFRELEPMTVAEPLVKASDDGDAGSGVPMCGGCGAKVGRDALRHVLDIPAGALREDVSAVPGDDAAVLTMGRSKQVITTDHLRAFVEDPVLMTRIAVVHALGDIWAMGAEPQAATVTLILPRMSPELQRRTLAEIMQTADEVMREAGASIVGGHTSMGAELTVGFSVTGLCKAAPLTISGAQAGDVLILTKPIGSGVILAAEMQGKAAGDVVAKCYQTLGQSQAGAAKILRAAHAMTDVTGFGLAGHLCGIAEASGVAITVARDAVPLLAGAFDLAEQGIGSTLLPDNRQGASCATAPVGALSDLMFDPQTAGGLLASVAADQAASLLKALSDQGYSAARIGHVSDGPASVVFS